MLNLSLIFSLPRPMLAEIPWYWFWDQMPPQRSTFAPELDFAYYVIYGVCVFFFLLVMAFMALFCLQYRRKHQGEALKKAPTHNNMLEIAWSVIPSFIVVYIFYLGMVGFMDMRSMPDEAYNISVQGAKWFWTFSYDNGRAIEAGQIPEGTNWNDRAAIFAKTPKMHVPVNTDIVLTMNSKDVLHSFFVPAFRAKQDVVPGRYTKLWFKATEVGAYDIFCTEYCGDKHSEMLGQVIVETQEEFDKWFAYASNLETRFDGDKVKIGDYLYNSRGCTQCHSIDGSPKANGGPSFLGAWGTDVEIDGIGKVKMDENYIRESILNPQAKVRKGYGKIMSAGLLTKDLEIESMIAFIKNLNEKNKK